MHTLVQSGFEASSESDIAAAPPKIRKILVIVNTAADRQANVEKAVLIATTLGSEIELFACDVQPSLPNNWAAGRESVDIYHQLLRKQRLDDVEHLAESVRSRDIPVRVTAEWYAESGSGIQQHIAKTKPDVVIWSP